MSTLANLCQLVEWMSTVGIRPIAVRDLASGHDMLSTAGPSIVVCQMAHTIGDRDRRALPTAT
jgi:hypothetical protein